MFSIKRFLRNKQTALERRFECRCNSPTHVRPLSATATLQISLASFPPPRHVEAFSQPGALTCGINYYRGMFRNLWNKPPNVKEIVRLRGRVFFFRIPRKSGVARTERFQILSHRLGHGLSLNRASQSTLRFLCTSI